jgi:hypothetical protein
VAQQPRRLDPGVGEDLGERVLHGEDRRLGKSCLVDGLVAEHQLAHRDAQFGSHRLVDLG